MSGVKFPFFTAHLKLICAKLPPCCYIPIMFRVMFLAGMSPHCVTLLFRRDDDI